MRMTTGRSALALALIAATAAACGSKDEPGKDWSGTPLDTPIESSVRRTPFRIVAPKLMKPDPAMSNSPDATTQRWYADLHDHFSEPSFSVSYDAIPAKDLDAFVRDAMLDADDIVAKKEATPDGFVLVTHTRNNGTVRAYVGKIKGEVHLTCEASQAKTGGVPNPAATMAWLERLCASLTIL